MSVFCLIARLWELALAAASMSSLASSTGAGDATACKASSDWKCIQGIVFFRRAPELS